MNVFDDIKKPAPAFLGLDMPCRSTRADAPARGALPLLDRETPTLS